VREVALEGEFDAIVGRWILMYLPEPAAALRLLATRLRAGGIMAFLESDLGLPPTMFPPSELTQQVVAWSVPPIRPQQGVPEVRMGPKLYRTYLEAGLPGPELMMEAPIGGGPDWPGYQYVADTMRSLLPAMERMIGLDPDEVGIDTLAERLREDAVTGGRVQQLPVVIGAWARKAA
jgi:hypothetical protein